MIGQRISTSLNACMIKFTGGGPYDGQSGLYDCDHENYTICTSDEDGVQYDYSRAGPKWFKLSRIWVDGKMVKL